MNSVINSSSLLGILRQKYNSYNSKLESTKKDVKEIFSDTWLKNLTKSNLNILRSVINGVDDYESAVAPEGISNESLEYAKEMIKKAVRYFPRQNSLFSGLQLSPELKEINTRLELLQLSKIMGISKSGVDTTIYCVYLDEGDNSDHYSTIDLDTIMWHLNKLTNLELAKIEAAIGKFTSNASQEIKTYISRLKKFNIASANVRKDVSRQEKQEAIPVLMSKLMDVFIKLDNDPNNQNLSDKNFITFYQVVKDTINFYSKNPEETLLDLDSNNIFRSKVIEEISGDILIKDKLREISLHKNIIKASLNKKIARDSLLIYTNSVTDLLYCLKEAFWEYADKTDQYYEAQVYSLSYYEKMIPTDSKSKSAAKTAISAFIDINKVDHANELNKLKAKIIDFKRLQKGLFANKDKQEQLLAEFHKIICSELKETNDIFIQFCVAIKTKSDIF